MTDDQNEIAFPETMEAAELSLKTLNPVFVVHPDLLSMEQIQYLKKLAEESGVAIQLGTGYKYCPAYDILIETLQTALVIDIRHQLLNSSDLDSQLKIILSYDFDFVTNILNAGFVRYDVKTWTTSGKTTDVLYCRMECDNGSIINLMAYTVDQGEPKLEMTFTSFDAVIHADVFTSVIEKRDLICNTTGRIISGAFCEKSIRERYLENFRRAVCNEPDALRNIDKQFQNLVIAEDVVKRKVSLKGSSG